MRGHEQVIALRRAGKAPSTVWLDDMDRKAGLTRNWHTFSQQAQVEIDRTESTRTLDLRFAVGLTVFASSTSRPRLVGITEAAMACGAARVIGSLFDNDRETSRHVAITDTAGKLVWEA